MAERSAEFAEKLHALQLQYAAQLEAELGVLRQEADELAAAAEPRRLLASLHQRLHRLAGSAGTFGFAVLGKSARELELQVKAWQDAGRVAGTESAAFIARVAALRETLGESSDAGTLPGSLAGADKAAVGETGRIFVVEDDVALGNELALALRYFGYETVHYSSLAAFESGLRDSAPDAVIMDVMFPAEGREGPEAVGSIFKTRGVAAPVIFISARDRFEDYLAVARAGGEGYFVKPLDIPKLVERLEQIFGRRQAEPCRILIVDDDLALAAHFRLVLEAAGMAVETLSEPNKILEVMTALRPDLVLMDVHMPECSGPDLARVIRLQDEWVGTPIVYLSAETDLDRQIEALGSGGNDFLTKPISDAHLAAAVSVRASRARQLAELMARDSLTGLLKHSRIKEQLAMEVARARRGGAPVSVAMVDIDHFKTVNDSYGHGMGDRVIKALAHLLRQRLRQSDSVGRYGGEEFAAVLPECKIAEAVKLLEDVRRRFEAIRFTHEGTEFSVTLSAGIASTEYCPDADGLLPAADAALYAAKHGGRNQVRAAGAPE